MDDDGTVYQNSAPPAPASITVPSFVSAGGSVPISWPAVTDPDGNLAGYRLQRSVNGGTFTQVYQGAGTSFSDTAPSSATTLQYRVQAYDDLNAASGWRTSSSVPVYENPTITVLPIVMQGQPLTVSWSEVDGADSYLLQRKADGGEWEQVYAGADTTFTDTAGSWSTVQYQVCGVFDGTNGAFAQSDVTTVVSASVLVISGTDGNLGTITSDIPYSVATDTGNQISLTRTVNGVLVASLTVNSGFAYSIPVMDLPTGMGTIVISATVQTSSDPVTVTRTWTYTKAAHTFPGGGGVAQLTKDGQNVFPLTLAEAVKAIGGPWGGNLSEALNKLALAAVYNRTSTPKYTAVTVDLSTVQAGDIVNLPVNGVMVPHIVVQVGNPDPEMYDSSCDGVWLLRQDIVENGQWNSTGVNTLAGATIMTTMQGYVADYDSTVQAAIQTVKIPYCTGGGNATINTLANGLECKMFPLSGYEVGWTTNNSQDLPVDGSILSYFQGADATDSKRIAYLSKSPATWYIRSPNISGSNTVWTVTNLGSYTTGLATNIIGYRPCFTLPTTFSATYYVDPNTGTVYPAQEYTTVGDFADLWGNIIPTPKFRLLSYTGTGTYGADNPTQLTVPDNTSVLLFLGYYVPVSNRWYVPSYDDAYDRFVLSVLSENYMQYAGMGGSTSAASTMYTKKVGDTVYWYSTASPGAQANGNGATYYFLAFYF